MSLTDNLMKIHTIAILLFLYAPIAIVVLSSFNEYGGLSSFKFTTRWYESLLQNSTVWKAFSNSLLVAILCALISVILGFISAYGLVRANTAFKSSIESIFYIPIIIPEITEALSLLLFYNLLSFPLGFISVLIGHTAFSISFVFVVSKARLAGFDRSLEEASMTLGANRLQTFIKITLPLSAPGIIASMLLSFTLSWDDFIKTVFTTGPGFQTIPLVIWSQSARGGVSPELNALTSLMLVISITLSYLYVKMIKR
ncbi:MAG: ABC transporter permease [Candidatus Methanomethylicia archaeon]